jgi:hypothetical protein
MVKKRVKKQLGGVMPGVGAAGVQRPLGGAGVQRPLVKKGGRVKAMHGGMKAKKKK